MVRILVFVFISSPALHAAVELNDVERDIPHQGELIQLTSRARISKGSGRCKHIDVGKVGELVLHRGIVIPRNKLAN